MHSHIPDSKVALDHDVWWERVQEVRKLAQKRRDAYVEKMVQHYNTTHKIVEYVTP